MTATTDTAHGHEHEGEHAEVAHAGDHAGHPSTRQYWIIFLILFVITAVEVALYYVSFSAVNLNNAVLGVLAIGKFAIVVGYFMHLRFDNRLLRRLFVTGLILAVLVYIAYMLTMGVFIDKPSVHSEL